ncbi:amidohydrolase family protein [Pseudomonas sp. A-R-19]|uniref:amidohydrolase family protein n=1 Tax=Pseudomonas sp. A-R-19 TaxID=2832403 RepID=UPI0021D84B8F|nr:amidohydrolase [Pseudomonas sp. A-R-19]
MPDIDGSLRELEYTMDALKTDGIVIERNQHGIYPGDERLDPIFAELDRRKAELFIHPTSPNCPCCQRLTMGYPAPMIEFMFETSRAVTNMILKGTLDKFPNIRLIIPHAGATMPLLIDRIIEASTIYRNRWIPTMCSGSCANCISIWQAFLFRVSWSCCCRSPIRISSSMAATGLSRRKRPC